MIFPNSHFVIEFIEIVKSKIHRFIFYVCNQNLKRMISNIRSRIFYTCNNILQSHYYKISANENCYESFINIFIVKCNIYFSNFHRFFYHDVQHDVYFQFHQSPVHNDPLKSFQTKTKNPINYPFNDTKNTNSPTNQSPINPPSLCPKYSK